MKKLIVVLLTLSMLLSLYKGTLKESVVKADEGFQAEETFNYKKWIFGNSTLSVYLEKIDKTTGEVVLNGVDTRRPTIPFIFSWGDGNSTEGWFPQTHLYEDRTKNYIITVTSRYTSGETDSANTIVFFAQPTVSQVSLDNRFLVHLPSSNITLGTSMPGWAVPSLSPINETNLIFDRNTIEYILSVASNIQADFVNYNVQLFNNKFEQVVLRDKNWSGGMYSLWFTIPPSFAVNKNTFITENDWSSLFHEMGHNYTLNFPSTYRFGGKVDGAGNAIYSETMAQIFQHATAYEIINRAKEFGIPDDIKMDIELSAVKTMEYLKSCYDNYVSGGMKFSTFNDPSTPEDETFLTFMTAAYKFLEHVEKAGNGYRMPVKRLMEFFSSFNPDIEKKYDSNNGSITAQTFRATYIIAGFSYALKEDLRDEFKKLNFPIDDKEFSELLPIKVSAIASKGGSISPMGSLNVEYSSSLTFIITPDKGYKISDVKVDGKSVGAVPTYTLQNITSDHTIEAIFEPMTFIITASAGTGGSIAPSGTITINYGDWKTFTIVPDRGYKISDVKVDDIPVGAVSTYTFTNIASDHIIKAIFEKKPITIVLQIGQASFTIDGTPNTLDSPPIIKNGRTLLPIRPVVEALGGSVSWDGNEKKVIISLGSTTIELWIGKSIAKVNGVNTLIDLNNPKVVPEIINGRTMLPLRFVTENLGCELQWDPNTQTITITYQG